MSNLDLEVPKNLIDILHVFDGMLLEGSDQASLKAAGAIEFPDSLRIKQINWDD